MELYIGKENESLKDVALKYNLTFEELLQFNKNYRFKTNLKDCPILIPQKEKTLVKFDNDKKEEKNLIRKIDDFKNEFQKLLLSYLIRDNFGEYLKESINKKYAGLQDELKKYKTNDPIKITASLDIRNFVDLFVDFIKSIKEKNFESIKDILQDMKKWPEKKANLFVQKYSSKLQEIFKNIIAETRDYILNIVGGDYFEIENNLIKIDNEIKKFKELLFD